MRTDDDPQAKLFEQMNAVAFQAHPYRRPIIGWMSDLENMSAADAKAWYDNWYVPNNAYVVVTGDVDHKAVFALAQQHYAATSSALNTTINAFQDQRTAPVDDPVARLFGAEDLKAEKSRNISAGVVLQPTITIDDRITLSSTLDVQNTAAQNYLVANGIPRGLYQSVRYFTNAVDTTTTGVDAVVQYRYRFDNGGRMSNSLGYSYARTRVTEVKPNPAVLSQNGLTLLRIDRRDQYGVLTDSTPRSKLSLATDYSLGPWGVRGNLVRYGKFVAISNSGPTLDQVYRAKWVLDLSASYRGEHWEFTVGSDNVANVYPDRRNALNNPGDQNVRYISYSPFGINGAFYYVKASYQW
jgi:iron complex outermembrane receptor protein